jgi:hypothetical protein
MEFRSRVRGEITPQQDSASAASPIAARAAVERPEPQAVRREPLVPAHRDRVSGSDLRQLLERQDRAESRCASARHAGAERMCAAAARDDAAELAALLQPSTGSAVAGP